jgi:hypothetical protein
MAVSSDVEQVRMPRDGVVANPWTNTVHQFGNAGCMAGGCSLAVFIYRPVADTLAAVAPGSPGDAC